MAERFVTIQSERKSIFSLRKNGYIGLFQYPHIPCLLRKTHPIHRLLPHHNPYIGTFNHSIKDVKVVPIKTSVSTQTDPVQSMIIGEKIIKAYGKNFEVLFNN